MTRLLLALTVVGAVGLAVGVGLIFPPAGVIVGSAECLAFGLLTNAEEG